MPRETTRFAPSPTGYLHLGHAFSALNAYRRARDSGGRFLLRIEDIDRSRCRAEFESAILDDLAWLGLDWETPVRRQSEHFDDYRRALEALDAQGLLYPCFCTRKAIAREVARAGLAPHGADGPRYSGACLALSEGERAARIAGGAPYALRLKAQEALRRSGPLVWHDEAAGEIAVNLAALGDAVLARKDIPASYHLAVVIDDALQGITLITRGLDLFPATPLHRLLQALLALPVPRYHHHRLIVDDKGQRLAKRTGAATLRARRERGMSAAEALRLIGA